VGLALGLSVGVSVAAVDLQRNASPARAAEMDPFRLAAGLWNGCDGWRYDSAPFKDANGDGIPEPFSYWWSGQPRFWNSSSIQQCWHNDENIPLGDATRPGVDYNSVGTPSNNTVLFETSHYNYSTYWPGVVFQSTQCAGVQAVLYAPTGLYLTTVKYWHTDPIGGVIGSNWVNHWDVPGQGIAYRNVATVHNSQGSDGMCTAFAPHLHQSANEVLTSSYPLAWTQANSTGDPTGATEFWLRWGTY
jgi:hypothetical protein